MPNRRELIAGAAALAVLPHSSEAATIGIETPAPPPRHPFFGVQPLNESGTVHALRMHWIPFTEPDPLDIADLASLYTTRGGRRHKLMCRIENERPQHECASIAAAEDLLLGIIHSDMSKPTERQIFDLAMAEAMERGAMFCNDGFASLAILINREANMIALRTRRGAGNVALFHPKRVELLSKTIATAYEPEPAKLDVHGWTLEGKLNRSIAIWSHPKMRDDRVYVVYRGESEIDCLGYLVETPDGTRLHLPMNTETSAGNFTDFIGQVGIRRCDPVN